MRRTLRKPLRRPPARYSRTAIRLLGRLIRAGRIERKLTAEELAVRAGISRALLYRIENGDPACSIGAMFEAATVAGVPLFEDEQSRLTMRVNEVESRLTLLPKSIQKARAKASDDF